MHFRHKLSSPLLLTSSSKGRPSLNIISSSADIPLHRSLPVAFTCDAMISSCCVRMFTAEIMRREKRERGEDFFVVNLFEVASKPIKKLTLNRSTLSENLVVSKLMYLAILFFNIASFVKQYIRWVTCSFTLVVHLRRRSHPYHHWKSLLQSLSEILHITHQIWSPSFR